MSSTASASASGAPSPLPRWIYKIFPHSSSDPRYTFPVPVPASHTFFLTELDYADGFVHLSAGAQVPGTLERFYADVEQVWVLRLETARVGAFKRLTWDRTGDGSVFPHLHAHLEGENIDSVRDVAQEGEKGWGPAVERLRSEGWLE